MVEFIPKLTQRFKLPNSEHVLYVSHDRTDIGGAIDVVECRVEKTRGTVWYHERASTNTRTTIQYTTNGEAYFVYNDHPFFTSKMDYRQLHKFACSGLTINDLMWSLVFAGIGEQDITFIVGRHTNAKRCRCIDASKLLINKQYPTCVGWITLQSRDGTFASAISVDELYENLLSAAMTIEIPTPIRENDLTGALLYMRHHKIPLFEK